MPAMDWTWVTAQDYCARGVEDVGGLDGAVLGEDVRPVFHVGAAAAFQDRDLRS